ncbi:MAG: NPCBM/NEW2 domain-containing protein [Thermoguttaceae bacterium]
MDILVVFIRSLVFFLLFISGFFVFEIQFETGLFADSFEIVDIHGNKVIGEFLEIRSEVVKCSTVNGHHSIVFTPKELSFFRSLSKNPFASENTTESVKPAQQRPRTLPIPALNSLSMPPNTSESSSNGAAQSDSAENSAEKFRKSFFKDAAVVELLDDTQLVLSNYRIKDHFLLGNDGEWNSVQIPIHLIRSIRFSISDHNSVALLPADWQKFHAENDMRGDRLVIGKPGSLDVYYGILSEITDTTVQFIVDGELLPVPRRKVFGLLLRPPNTNRSESISVDPLYPAAVPISENDVAASNQNIISTHDSIPANNTASNESDTFTAEEIQGRLFLWDGSEIQVVRMELDSDNRLRWKHKSGFGGITSLSSVRRFDFQPQNNQFVSELIPTRCEQALFCEGEPKIDSGNSPLLLFEKFRSKRMGIASTDVSNSSSSVQSVRLDAISYLRGMVLPAKTTLEYKLEKSFRKLRGVVGIDDRARPNGQVRLSIHVGNQLLTEIMVRGIDSATRLDLLMPESSSGQILRFTVDFGDNLQPASVSLGDLVLLE